MKRLAMTVLLFALLAAMPFAQAAATPPDIVGEWDLTTVSPVGENTNTVEFKKDADGMKAIAKGPQGERPYDTMALDGDKLTLVITIDYQGQPMIITYVGTISEKSINGSADFGGLAMGNFSAVKKEAEKAEK
jgi:hypothetical protein